MFKDRLRVEVVLWLAIIMVLAYMDRSNFAVAAPIIMKEFGINAAQLGIIFSAFTAGYMVVNFPGGFIAERFGARFVLAGVIFLWSVMTIGTAYAWSFMSLLVIRVIFGMCEGPMIPATTKIVSMWVTPKERGMASGLWMAAIPVGAMIGNAFSGIIVTVWGWHSVFYIFGILGFLFAYLTWRIIRNHPEEHPKITKEEIDVIKTGIVKHEGVARLAESSTVSQLLRNPWMWLISIIYVCNIMLFWANLSWLPTYFVMARGSSVLKSGFISAVPWIAGAVGAFAMGWLSDHFGKIRGVWLAVGLFVIAPFIAYATIAPSLEACLACFVIAIFFNVGCTGLMFAVPMEVFPVADVAKVSGIMLGFGSISGIIAPSLVGFVVQYTHSFNAAYYVFAILSLLGGLLSLALVKKEKGVYRQREAIN
jgi:ACS family hexuronate transporter-like MFS transporter